MDIQSSYDLPDDVVEHLLCCHCNSYLSCAPIKIDLNGAAICGRCAPSHTEEAVHQVLFETTMAKFTFPCRYKLKGCTMRVLFNRAMEHELECRYRTFYCPYLPYGNCTEQVSVVDIHKHFQENHADLILKEGKFKLKFDQDVQCNLLMIKDNITALIQYDYDSVKKTLYLDVRRIAQNDKQIVHYKLQIVNGLCFNNTINVKEQSCKFFESQIIDKKNALCLSMDNYLPALENPHFVYINVALTVNSTNCENDMMDMDSYEKKAARAWDLLEKFRCSKCSCLAMHYSNENNLLCYECNCSMQTTRTHEEIIEISNFPCKWQGCTFIGNGSNIKTHIKNCQFQSYICPISVVGLQCDAGFFTSATLINHMKKHGRFCPNPEKIVIQLFHPSNVNRSYPALVYFTVFENKIILFKCSFKSNFDWILSSYTNNLLTETHFEHDHCRFKSRTYTSDGYLDFKYGYVRNLPSCFSKCKRIVAVIKIKKEINHANEPQIDPLPFNS